MSEKDEVLPQWAPRVEKRKIKRLYEDDARGIRDEELLEDVGYSLLFRCESFIAANQACGGQALCAACGQIVQHSGRKEEILTCASCGWKLSWGRYFNTIQHKQLRGGEDVMGPFREYIAAFQRTRDPRERMILIDQLIHGFHGYIKEMKVRRPVCVNLIEGKMHDVIKFLDALSAGGHGTPALTETHALWRSGLKTKQYWYRIFNEQEN
ncbi:MAG: hypothetical protein HOC74_11105 [Gemmatimonadetes bacterium]|jgi:hypothetical protein|nr:hypothetical protein [Gemmatimonadota bacterium]